MSVLRWVFLTAPARAYKRGEATGGSVPWIYLFALFGVAGLGGVLGCAGGLLIADPAGGFGIGLMAGLLALTAWSVYVLVLVGVMRLRRRPLETLLGEGWEQRPQHWYDK